MSITSNEIISFRNFSFRYSGSRREILRGINLEIAKGQLLVLAGMSGSGKSTLLRAINGLIPHQHAGEYSGSVFVDGFEVEKTKMSDLAVRVGYIFQNPENQIFMFSVERDIAFGLENLGVPRSEIRERVDSVMSLLGISDLALRAPHELSDGQKQRVAIAGVIAMRPSVVIFDEPTSLLDPFTAKNVIGTIKRLHDELGITVLIVEHRLDLVSRIADRIIVLDSGEIILDGAPRDVLFDSEVSLYGVNEPAVVKVAKKLGPPISNRKPLAVAELASLIQSG